MAAWWPATLTAVVLTSVYLVALLRRPGTLPGWNAWRTAAWVVGTLAVAAAISPTLGESAHQDHRFHMVQHLALGMYAPLALVAAAPVTLLLGSLPRVAQLALTRVLRSRPVRVVSHPISAAVLNIGGMFVLYLTPLYDVSMSRPFVHWLVMAHFLLAGWLYTWAIAGPDPGPSRPGMAVRVVVLIAAAGAHAFLAKYLYANAHQMPRNYGAAEVDHHGDAAAMEEAAQWMYYGGDIAELLLAFMLFSWWWRRTGPR